MRKLVVDVDVLAASVERMGNEGRTPLYAAIGGRLAAIVAVADPIKEATPGAIAALHELGLKVALITGDNRHTAEGIARQLGIDEGIAEVLPEGKVGAVRKIKEKHGRAGFGGDGINGAPALGEAGGGLAV